jgi:acyl carrier protein
MSLTNKVIEVVSSSLKIDKEKLNEKSGLGDVVKWDSLNHAGLVVDLENHFDVGFGFDELDKIITIEAIVESLEEKGVGA